MKVPTKFDPEPTAIRCGESFDRQVLVTGEIPYRGGFGKDNKRYLRPVIEELPTGEWWSNKSEAEQAFVTLVIEARARLESDLVAAKVAGEITDAQRDTIIYLIQLSDANLAQVQQLYDYWDGETWHPELETIMPRDPTFDRVSNWPLIKGDNIAAHQSECADVEGEWVEDRELVGASVAMVGYFYCPTKETKAQRKKDREAIHQLLLDAAKAIRCGEWGLWRMVLYRQSLVQWDAEYGGFGLAGEPGVGTPAPPKPQIDAGPGQLKPPTLDEPPPWPGPEKPPDWEPPNFRLIDVGDLPPLPTPEGELEPPPTPPIPPPTPTPTEKKKPSKTGIAAAAAGVLGALYFLTRK
jgi:hypothetical protein